MSSDKDAQGRPRSNSPRRKPDKPMSDEEVRAKDAERHRKKYREKTDPKKEQ